MHQYIFYQIKTPFPRNSVLIMGHHDASVFTLFFSLTYVTCIGLHPTVVIRYSTSVTYRTLCHVSGHLVIYTPSCFFKSSLGPAVQTQHQQGFMLIFKTQSRPICLIAIHKRSICGRFYLRVKAGQSQNINLHR